MRTVVAGNIDRAIRAKGLTNRQVGEAIGTTEHQVWRWRRARIKPSDQSLVALAGVLTDGDVFQFYIEHDAEAAA